MVKTNIETFKSVLIKKPLSLVRSGHLTDLLTLKVEIKKNTVLHGIYKCVQAHLELNLFFPKVFLWQQSLTKCWSAGCAILKTFN